MFTNCYGLVRIIYFEAQSLAVRYHYNFWNALFHLLIIGISQRTAASDHGLFYRMQAIENDKPDLNVAAQNFQKARNEIIRGSFERAEKIAKLMVLLFFFLITKEYLEIF